MIFLKLNRIHVQPAVVNASTNKQPVRSLKEHLGGSINFSSSGHVQTKRHYITRIWTCGLCRQTLVCTFLAFLVIRHQSTKKLLPNTIEQMRQNAMSVGPASQCKANKKYQMKTVKDKRSAPHAMHNAVYRFIPNDNKLIRKRHCRMIYSFIIAITMLVHSGKLSFGILPFPVCVCVILFFFLHRHHLLLLLLLLLFLLSSQIARSGDTWWYTTHANRPRICVIMMFLRSSSKLSIQNGHSESVMMLYHRSLVNADFCSHQPISDCLLNYNRVLLFSLFFFFFVCSTFAALPVDFQWPTSVTTRIEKQTYQIHRRKIMIEILNMNDVFATMGTHAMRKLTAMTTLTTLDDIAGKCPKSQLSQVPIK